MTGAVKNESPKKGKENKNVSNHIPVPSTLRKNAKNEAKNDQTPKKEKVESTSEVTKLTKKLISEKKSDKVEENVSQNKTKEDEDNSSSTSNRSIRPQTKILRRPTPNLKHPVIQVDSDDSGGDSSSSDKSKDDNPKRLKMGVESSDSSSHKRKNFIMYNKYNVDKNIKNTVKERTSATVPTAIPNPCNSCNRTQAPERLHSHARKDARGLMNRQSPAMDVRMASPQKKTLSTVSKDKTRNKESKSSPATPNCSKEEKIQTSLSEPEPELSSTQIQTDNKESSSEICVTIGEPKTPIKNFEELSKMCYICHKEFKVSLLLIHESKCLEVRNYFFIF